MLEVSPHYEKYRAKEMPAALQRNLTLFSEGTVLWNMLEILFILKILFLIYTHMHLPLSWSLNSIHSYKIVAFV